MRRLLLGVAAAGAALGLVDATAARAAPRVAHPNPALVEIHLDYVNGLSGLGGLDPAVVAQAVADQQYLAYETADDLGGFRPAVVGRNAFSGGGRNVVGRTNGRSEIPQFAQAAGGLVNSFAAVGGSRRRSRARSRCRASASRRR